MTDRATDTNLLCRRVGGVIAILVFAAGAALLLPLPTFGQPKKPPEREKAAPESQADIFPLPAAGLDPRTGFRDLIPSGSKEDADRYYAGLAKDLGLKDIWKNLDELLVYFGYQALQASDLEELPPSTLMGSGAKLEAELRGRWKVRTEDDFPAKNEFTVAKVWAEQQVILSARYFSPKTSDVSGLYNKLSWRKVVRLEPRPGSDAAVAGMARMYFLSVSYVADLTKNPFAGRSLNAQVILVRDPANKAAKLVDPMCWLVFDPARNYARTESTATSWDAADPDLVEKHGVQPYFVPDACSHCHGGRGVNVAKAKRFPRAVPQYFDTDHMQDRTTPGDDFERTLGRSRWATLFDGGRNPYTARYRANFTTFWKLNKEMLAPTLAVDSDPKQQLPSTLGLRNWLRLHGDKTQKELASVLHVPPIQRGIPDDLKATGAPKGEWSEKEPVDFQLLPLLNRYCYRCHSGLAYNVFDKGAVKKRASKLIGRLRETDKTVWMPQDRRLSFEEKKRLIELLEALKEQK